MENFYYKANRLQQLRGFVFAAQFGSISKAAKHLKVSHAAISVQIKSLERDLGSNLFIRNGPRIELSADGSILLEMAQPLVDDLDEIPKSFARLKKAYERTELAIASNTTGLNFILPALIKKLIARHPSIHVNIHHAEHEESVDKLRKGEVELVLLPKREHKPFPSDLRYLEKFIFQPSLISLADHPLAGRKNLTVKEIGQYELTLPSKDLRVIPNLYDIFPQNNINKRLRIKFVNWETTRKYIEAGLAISISSDVIIQANDTLVATPLNHLFDKVSYGFLIKKRVKLSKNATYLLGLAT